MISQEPPFEVTLGELESHLHRATKKLCAVGKKRKLSVNMGPEWLIKHKQNPQGSACA